MLLFKNKTFVMSTLALFLTAKAMVYLVIALFVGLINSISIIVIQCNCINDANNNNILKVLPYNLCGLWMSLLCISICQHMMWLQLAR